MNENNGRKVVAKNWTGIGPQKYAVTDGAADESELYWMEEEEVLRDISGRPDSDDLNESFRQAKGNLAEYGEDGEPENEAARRQKREEDILERGLDQIKPDEKYFVRNRNHKEVTVTVPYGLTGDDLYQRCVEELDDPGNQDMNSLLEIKWMGWDFTETGSVGEEAPDAAGQEKGEDMERTAEAEEARDPGQEGTETAVEQADGENADITGEIPAETAVPAYEPEGTGKQEETAVTISGESLPANIEDLAKFVLVEQARFGAVLKALKSIEKLGVAADVRKRAFEEAQMISETLLEAEIRLGELTAALPTSQGKRTDKEPADIDDQKSAKQETKTKILERYGLKPRQALRYETMARNPEAVDKVKKWAEENGELITQKAVMNEIKKSSVKETWREEWITPEQFVESAKKVMGRIDLDPASSETANGTVGAERYYDEEQDGLTQEWSGTVWLNPPRSEESAFIDKLCESHEEQKIEQAIVMADSATDAEWFAKLMGIASAVVFYKGQFNYQLKHGDKTVKGPVVKGPAFIYLGENTDAFLETFSEYGWGVPLR